MTGDDDFPYRLKRPIDQKPVLTEEAKEFIHFSTNNDATHIVYLKDVYKITGPLYVCKKNFELMEMAYGKYIDHYETINLGEKK